MVETIIYKSEYSHKITVEVKKLNGYSEIQATVKNTFFLTSDVNQHFKMLLQVIMNLILKFFVFEKFGLYSTLVWRSQVW